MNSPLWVHMVAGLGSGLFLFDEDGCPENPLDNDSNRAGCDGNAPATHFDPADAAFDLDRIVETLLPLSADDRRAKVPAAPDRAPYLVAGAVIIDEVLAHAGHAGMKVSDRGLRFGLLAL